MNSVINGIFLTVLFILGMFLGLAIDHITEDFQQRNQTTGEIEQMDQTTEAIAFPQYLWVHFDNSGELVGTHIGEEPMTTLPGSWVVPYEMMVKP